MNLSQRLVLNTSATYIRSILSAGLALFSSRWVLGALGQSDYGLYSLVGSLIIFIVFLNSIMANSASRYFAYAIGQGKNAEVNRWFNTAVGIHICLAFVLVLVGWPLGEYAISHILTIPVGRVVVGTWIFRISLISAFFSMISVPFIAMFTAKQLMVKPSFWGLVYSVMTFTLAFNLPHVTNDPLLIYAAVMGMIVILVQTSQMIRALIHFQECKISFQKCFDKQRIKEILSFASWNLIDPLGAMLTGQGTAVLLNLFFGAKINAAYGIANQVSSQTNQLSTSMIGAFTPEITASEGKGERERMLRLSQRANKIGTILVVFFAIPLLAEMDYVLKLWLISPPPFTGLFCQLILITMIIDRLSTGYMVSVNAHGKIAGFQATIGFLKIMTLPLAWLFLKLGYPRLLQPPKRPRQNHCPEPVTVSPFRWTSRIGLTALKIRPVLPSNGYLKHFPANH